MFKKPIKQIEIPLQSVKGKKSKKIVSLKKNETRKLMVFKEYRVIHGSIKAYRFVRYRI